MERELLVTGIGGQGVQLAAQVLARGATLEGSHVMLFGVYAGAMRAMNTDATVVIGDAPLQSPPLISHTWSAIGMHDKFWEPVARKLRPEALVLVNDATFETAIRQDARVYRVPTTELAADFSASMVMAGAFAAISELVGLDALIGGMRESVPSYRQQHVTPNEAALTSGYDWGQAA
ncbi:MAG: 2-oxoacid:acceptor oxidoreductase family protein [Acidimicrobiia bacterium]